MIHYDFVWDRGKARRNRRKHRVSFEQGATVFRDPRAASLYDEKHSEAEERWVTLGISSNSGLLVVHHTFEEIDADHIRIRIISCRKATPAEIRRYGER
uniref:Uncharacterized protein n=1 Tax=Candidatus Kentrum sp. FM TaxID=2126340 RepID=A0A450U2U4_9GAMM|nr:MAG: hypothetical protein BECKFM1743C_GA0114222_108104 [Candidatus Kentron sp. FM]VFJ77452.1 MAG: hypothetical protein BECKFM1743A_GA0114220_109873 [Candidatus Kentron sp. FM]VFK23575.1 MAG: hypothetical protein BECKFM1743B_GA0114221_109351 [Candidatus Kentron sp. FM]